uniref:Uncharacterized protein n=1 Tax=Amphiprion percula TaxID=161767 RepID=A0A3P8T3N0_AMPPE
MVPLAIIDFLIDCLGLFHLEGLGTLGILWLLLGLAVAEKEKSVGLCGSEVKGDGACLLSVPLVEDDKRLGCLKGDGV